VTPPAAVQSRMSRYIVLTVLLLGMLAAGFVFLNNLAAVNSEPTPTAQAEGITAVQPPMILSDFTLTNQRGEETSFSDLQGKWTLLFFGYTNCPDYCPITLTEYKRIRDTLGEDAAKVQFVFVSVDGTRDTPQVVADYLTAHGVDDFVIGLTGGEETVREIGAEYGLYVDTPAGTPEHEHTEEAGYGVDHSTQSFLIDPEGNLRVIYNFATEFDAIVANLREYI
jgi:protein SCO1